MSLLSGILSFNNSTLTTLPKTHAQVMVDGRVLSRAGVHHLPVKTLDGVMAQLNHTWINVLKIDVEGSEWGALQRMLAVGGPLPFTQMQARRCCCCCCCCCRPYMHGHFT